MKTKHLLLCLGALLCVALYSFATPESEENRVVEKTISIEEHKKGTEVLVAYYAEILQAKFDQAYAESVDGVINEQEILASLPLPEYGCAYTGDNCTGEKVCGVSLLYAETFGYESWSGSQSQSCEDTDPYFGGPER